MLQRKRIRSVNRSTIKVIFCTAVICICGCQDRREGRELWTSEAALREIVTKSRLPSFDNPDQVPRGVSVLVALVALHGDGAKQEVEIIESPSPLASRYAVDALRGWKFRWKPSLNGEVLKGRITFYIVNSGDRVTVFNSDAAPPFAELRRAGAEP